jgi:uncharacterized glyoxalase superfamily protein PhnB
MRFHHLTPMLMCDDVQASIRFYADVLGFTVTSRMDSLGRSGWAMLRQGGVELMLASSQEVPPSAKVGGRYPQVLYYFYPDDVVALRQSIVAKGYPCGELVVRIYRMKEFEVVDPSGHVLWFGQETDEPPTPEI